MNKLKDLKLIMDQMKIKKSVLGGYSKTDVQNKMNIISTMVQEAIKEQSAREADIVAKFEERIEELKKEFEDKKHLSDVLIIDLNKNISELTEEKIKMEEEQLEMKNSYKVTCENMLKEYKVSLRALSGEFSRILENVSNVQKMIDEENIFEGLDQVFIEKKNEE